MKRWVIVTNLALSLVACKPEKEEPQPDIFQEGVNPAQGLVAPVVAKKDVDHVRLQANPGHLNFGGVTENQSVTRKVGIINNSSESLTLQRTEAFGATESYQLSTDCTEGVVLQPKAGCTITLGYTPVDSSLHEAEIIVSYTDGLPLKIAVSGQGKALQQSSSDPSLATAMAIASARQQMDLNINQNNNIINQEAADYTGQWDKYPNGLFDSTKSTFPVDRSRIITADRYIPAVLENTINSELPEGRIIAVVERNVYGSDGKFSLIPGGSRIIGRYTSLSRQGDNRLAVSWNRIIRPDGASIKLQQAEGADPMGRLGLIGDVDSRFFQKYGSSILTSLISVLPEYFAGDDQTVVAGANNVTSNSTGKSRATERFSEDMSFLARRMIEENLRLEPIITVPQGTRLQVIPNQDIYLASPDEFVALTDNQGKPKPLKTTEKEEAQANSVSYSSASTQPSQPPRSAASAHTAPPSPYSNSLNQTAPYPGGSMPSAGVRSYRP